MAADKKFELEIQTKADTKGAKEAEAALNNVEKAAHKAEAASAQARHNPMALPAGYTPKAYESPEEIAAKAEAKAAAEKRLADYVAEREAKQEKLNRAIEREADARRRVQEWRAKEKLAIQEAEAAEVELAQATAARTTAWAASGAAIFAVAKLSIDQVDKVAQAMAKVDPKWAEEHAIGLQAITMLAHPIDTFWDVMTDGALKSVQALAASKQAAKEAKENLDKMITARQNADRAFQTTTIENTLKREKEAADDLVAALERAQQIARAREANQAAQDQATITQAQASGGDATGAQTQARANAFARDNAEEDRKLAAAQAKLEAAVKTAQYAADAAAAIQLSAGVESEKYKQAASAASDAERTSEAARADVEALKAISEQNRQALKVTFDAEQAKLTAAIRDDIKVNAEEALKEVSAKADEIAAMPKQIRDTVSLAFNSIQQALADGLIDERESGAVVGQIAALAAALRGRDDATARALDSLIRQVNEANRRLDQLSRAVPSAPTPFR